MLRAFREPIRNKDGDIRFPAGVPYEWPKQTFQRIALNVGKELDEITVTPEEMGKIFTAAVVSDHNKSKTRPRPVLKRRSA